MAQQKLGGNTGNPAIPTTTGSNATGLNQSTSDWEIKAPASPGQSQIDLMGELPSPLAAGAGQVDAAQVKLPDFGNLPQIQSFVPQIREAGQMRLESGLAALRENYGAESEDLESQIAGAGTYDSGDAYKLKQRMFQHRGSQEMQLTKEIQAESLIQEVSELQRKGQITEERARMMIDMEFQSAIQNGDWQQAAALHNSEMKLRVEELNTNIIGMKSDIAARGHQEILDWAEIEIGRVEADMKARGLDIEQHRVDVAEYHEDILRCDAHDDGVAVCLRIAREDMDARLDIASGGNGGMSEGDRKMAEDGGSGIYGGNVESVPIGTDLQEDEARQMFNNNGITLPHALNVGGYGDRSGFGARESSGPQMVTVGNTTWLVSPQTLGGPGLTARRVS